MRILLLEDDFKAACSLKANLKREFFAVDIAPNEEKTIYLCKTTSYDLIILGNPGICAKIRERGLEAPIIGICTDAGSASKIALLRAGADDCLGKPFSHEELVARIHTILRRPRLLYTKELRLGELVLDINNHVVTRQNQKVSLTRKEFMLLEYLMRNAGSVVSRGQILEHVWDMNADPFSNTIESHILSLRKKISSSNKQAELIKTISGRGYKIDC